MLKSELEKKYQNMREIAIKLEELKNIYKEKCELLEQYNKVLKTQVRDLQILLADSDISNN